MATPLLRQNISASLPSRCDMPASQCPSRWAPSSPAPSTSSPRTNYPTSSRCSASTITDTSPPTAPAPSSRPLLSRETSPIAGRFPRQLRSQDRILARGMRRRVFRCFRSGARTLQRSCIKIGLGQGVEAGVSNWGPPGILQVSLRLCVGELPVKTGRGVFGLEEGVYKRSLMKVKYKGGHFK